MASKEEIDMAVKAHLDSCNKVIKLSISESLKKKFKQDKCKHDWVVIYDNEWTQDLQCTKCEKWKHL